MARVLLAEDRQLRKRQVVWTLVFLFTISLALIGVAYGMFVEYADGLTCPTPGMDSNWGELSWSVLPPGPRCTWSEELNGITRVEGPGPVMSVWLASLVILTVSLGRVYRRAFPRWTDRP